jgi:hypothetical protein
MSGYIGPQPVPQATQHREAFTATASQTSFATAGYTPQFIDVYLNGVKLAPADYTATNGSDVVLTTGAAASDILEYVAYTPFEVANQTFTGTTAVDVLTVTGAATGTNLTLSGGVFLGGTAAANRLNDYEEGTWTPTVLNSASALVVATGSYTKVGNRVMLNANITFGATGNANAVVFGGLPFTCLSASDGDGGYKVEGTVSFESLYFVLGSQLRPLTGAGAILSYTSTVNERMTFSVMYRTA